MTKMRGGRERERDREKERNTRVHQAGPELQPKET